ncbi:hypothetical protein NLI96_g10910 [Meripilus lineatus]|uniref:Glycoside hydrolase family 76 protein n=1 Tax=Meripilus lineatus TaxID=2056292 RepID=A0AAD5USS2_9APHY|nr:hypothetical protein NLI96_g10910 [Physisporinus lineatus]
MWSLPFPCSSNGVLRIILPLLLLLNLVHSQDLSVPGTWRKPTSDSSRDDREFIARGIIDSMASRYNESSGEINGENIPSSRKASAKTRLGLVHQSTGIVRSRVASGQSLGCCPAFGSHLYVFNIVGSEYGSLSTTKRWNSDSLAWYLAAFYAYRAYNDSSLLALAKEGWEATNAYMVTPENAATGTHPAKNVAFNGTCQGASVAGAVFLFPDNVGDSSFNTEVNGATVCAFLALSAHLLEETSDPKYQSAAALTLQFIRSHLYNGTIILDKMYLSNCVVFNDSWTYNTGFFVEGLSIYANLTQDMSLVSFLKDLVATSVKFPVWTPTNGVMTEALRPNSTFNAAFKGIFVRGLFEAWKRNPTDQDLIGFIQNFVLVQYNALLDLAKTPGLPQFTSDWPGPPSGSFLPWGQLAALDVFNAALGFLPRNTIQQSPVQSSTASSAPTGSSTQHQASKPLGTGAIIGIVVAICVFLFGLIAATLIFILRHRRKGELRPSPETPVTDSIHGSVIPFMMQAPSAPDSTVERRLEKGSSPAVMVIAPISGGPSSLGASEGQSPSPARALSSNDASGSGNTATGDDLISETRENGAQMTYQNNLPGIPTGDLVQILNFALANLTHAGATRSGDVPHENPPEYER